MSYRMVSNVELEEIIKTLKKATPFLCEEQDNINCNTAISILENVKLVEKETENFVVKDTYTKGKNAGLRKALLLQ